MAEDEPVHVPTDEEREMLDQALADLERDPDAGQPWEKVRADLWPDMDGEEGG